MEVVPGIQGEMTTIVVSRKQQMMVSDSLCTGQVNVRVQKVFDVDGQLVGFAGHAMHGLKFVEWLKHGTAPQFVYDRDENTFDAVVLNDDGLFYYDRELIAQEILDDVFAIGSGSHYALGAIDAGASLIKAVEIAAGRDDGTGLPVVVFKRKRGKR